MRRIPLRNREKCIIAWTLVDNEDYKNLSKWSWCLSDQGYATRRKNIGHKKSFVQRMHREIMNAKAGQIIDHVNSKRLDNRKENLRFCTKAQNGWNRGKRRKNSSGYKCVFWMKREKRWYAKLKVNKKEIRSGNYLEKKDAVRAAKELFKKYHGQFQYGK